MYSKTQIAVNVICFQGLWWICVLSPAYRLESLACAVCLSFAGWHLHYIEGWIQAWPLMITALLGSVFDQAGYTIGMIGFQHGTQWPGLVPVWMGALWLAFACTLSVSLHWLQRRVFLAGILGALFGPLAYWGAEKLGAVTLPAELLSLIWLALGWGILLPAMLRIRAICSCRGGAVK